ncbi:DUF3515 domain-containing protein [Streptomyces albidoflavus]|uniref:DUF3515 domain-containing protein n=1 Tax=Streptomyces TaxID=1883 RepID=UPI000A1C976E|nr:MULTISPECIES: DUF3515 domain-containing protein [Streptomyces]MBK3385932.1 DUF3515 domain-containing protein [Streptomyces sp. DEF147AK]MBK3391856.1 DUF3515 domain-containing protein [Streptomyces sp. DEF1AK]MCM3821343.1 DUF3515 domain-containing protein [Streptomyces sp. DR3-1]RZE83427.1 DUF3515 domain-containing protein [Streptomyces albidoflavus]WTC35151.1 DUF3515 domain-containing protein [Streptomyces albidoflavus]
MNLTRRRSLRSAAAALLLAAVAGCSSTGGRPAAAVPGPDSATATLCHKLDDRLPQRVAGMERNDPEPESALTAGWGSPAIILRCGVPRPGAMNDPDAEGVEADGVGWLMEQPGDGSFRFTTTLRRAYVEVALPAEHVPEGLAPLSDLAPSITEAVPEGIAD